MVCVCSEIEMKHGVTEATGAVGAATRWTRRQHHQGGGGDGGGGGGVVVAALGV